MQLVAGLLAHHGVPLLETAIRVLAEHEGDDTLLLRGVSNRVMQHLFAKLRDGDAPRQTKGKSPKTKKPNTPNHSQTQRAEA